jgi:short-subunit dehydrogenase
MNKHILITGATKGIGRACAAYFAAKEWDVTALARTSSDLEDMAEDWAKNYPASTLHCLSVDLAKETDILQVPAKAYDVVLLNAAAFSPGRLLEEGEDLFPEMLNLNVLGNHRLARRLLPAMRAESAGHLVVIGSTGTDHWKGHMTAYVATKFALRGLFLGWEKDLVDTGVSITLVAPGATLTASWANETPPPDILMPEEVAEIVGRVVAEGVTGRVVVGNK